MKKINKDTVVFYHARCPDGFGSAYAFWKKFGNQALYKALDHEKRKDLDLSLFEGKQVFMADIALDRDMAIELNDVAAEFQIIDHHKSAQEEIGDLPFAKFEMKNSGAVLSWEYLFGTQAPLLLRHVEDRDLWRFDNKNTDSVLLYADSIGHNFKRWALLEKELEDEGSYQEAIKKGDAIKGYRDRVVRSMLEYSYILKIGGYDVPTVNSPFFRSEIVGDLCKDSAVPFAAGYHFDGEKFIFSLRSRGDGVDVSKVAASYPGGGGHKQSAGFAVKRLEDL